jgi:hypothetical protein
MTTPDHAALLAGPLRALCSGEALSLFLNGARYQQHTRKQKPSWTSTKVGSKRNGEKRRKVIG